MVYEPSNHVGAALPLMPAPHIFKDRTATGAQLAARL
jgi:hypothetical protein